jgi:Arc/MetJ family transcription regulator
MRTTLNLDDEALAAAQKVAPGKTKTAVINEALRDFARRKRLRGLLQFEGKGQWVGDIDTLRKRRRRRQ